MTRDERLSGPAARWILALVLLVAVVGVIFVTVVKRGTSEGPEAKPARPQPPSRPGPVAAWATMAIDDLADPHRPADRRQLAEHLRRLRRAAGDPQAPGAQGVTAARGTDDRGGARRGGHADPREDGSGQDGSGQDGSGEDGSGEDAAEEGQDDVQWPVDRSGIQGAIKARIEEIKECYQGWLSEDPELGGRIVVTFAIEAGDEGAARIREAAIQGSEVDHAGLERCILVMVESLQFEPPSGGRVVVRYPFAFSPRPAQDVAPRSE